MKAIHNQKEKRVRICKDANELTVKQQKAYDHLLANHDISYHDYLLLFKSAGKKLISDGYVEIYEIEKAYISKYEEFSGYKDYIFNVLDTYDFERYIETRFNIITAPVEYNIWIRKNEKK